MVRSTKSPTPYCKPPRRWALATGIGAVLVSQAWLAPPLQAQNLWKGEVSSDIGDFANWSEGEDVQAIGDALINGNTPHNPVWTIGDPTSVSPTNSTYLYLESLSIGAGVGSNGLFTVNTALDDSFNSSATLYLDSSSRVMPFLVGSDGGTGQLDFNLRNSASDIGTQLDIYDQAGQFGMVVGTGNASTGTVNINGLGNGKNSAARPGYLSGGKVTSYQGTHFIGSDGGTGTVNVRDASWITGASSTDPNTGAPLAPMLNLGVGTGSVGTLNVLSGGKASFGSHGSYQKGPSAIIGADGGTGILNIDGINASGYASTGYFATGLDIGSGANSTGQINVLGGGKLVSHVHDAALDDPATGGRLDPELPQLGIDGGTGSVTVSGSGSLWQVGAAASSASSLHIFHNEDGSVTREENLDEITDGTQIGHLHVGVSGTGNLTIADGGLVSLGVAYVGNIDENSPTESSQSYGMIRFDGGLGTLFLGETATGNGTLNIGAEAGKAAVATGDLFAAQIQFGPGAGKVVFNHTGTNYIFRTPLVGNGVLANHAGTTWLQPILPLPAAVAVDNRDFSGATELYGGTLGLGYAQALGSSAVQVKGDASLIYANGIAVNNSIDLQAANTLSASVADGGIATQTGVISGSGNLLKTDPGTLFLTASNSYTGETRVGAGTLALSGAGSVAQSSRVLVDGIFDIAAATSPVSIRRLAGAGTVNFGSQSLSLTAAADTFAGNLAGSGDFNLLDGVQILSGDSSAFTGANAVQGGELWVNGTLGNAASNTTVSSGALLGGGGLVGGAVFIGNGAVLVPGAEEAIPGELRIGGDLTLDPGATMRFLFGQAGQPGGALNDLLTVGGNLILDGTLEVSQAAGGTFDPGVYRVIDYAGSLDDRGLTLGSVPPSFASAQVQTSVDNQVNLVLAPTGVPLSFWDGAAGPKDDGNIDGGDGTWQNSGGNNNWTDANGAVNAAFADGSFAVFSAAAGKVSVDDSLGAIEVDGMQFASSGYVLSGDSITLLGPDAVVRVGASSLGRKDFLTRIPEHDATINSVLAGDARLKKTDAGTLILNGNNTYSGGTYIRDGVLQIASDQALGASTGDVTFGYGALRTTADISSARTINVETGAAILTEGDTTLSLSGALSGSGALIKGGTGTLHLTGASSFNGATRVASGLLLVDGNLADSAVTVDSLAFLAGNGTVGSTTVRAGGFIAPGNSIGTLTINGNYAQEAGAHYIVELDPTSSASDLIAASGTATLAKGALLQVMRTSNALYRAGTRYTVLSADGGVNGTYTLQGEVTVSPFLSLADTYDANHAYLEVTQTGQLTDVDCSPNANAAAGGAGGLTQGGDLNTALLNQPNEASACNALGQLSGEIHASLRGAQLEDSRFVREAIGNRVRSASADIDDPQSSDGVWAHAFGSWGRLDHGRDTQVLSRNIKGLFIGADWSLSNHWRAGLLGGYGKSNMDVRSWRSSASSDDKHLGLYTAGQWDNGIGFHAGLAYAWHDLEVKRQIEFAHFNDQLRADYKATTQQAFTELNYRMQMARMALYPFVNVAYVKLDSDGFQEQGGEAALHARSQDNTLTFATAGMRSSRQFELRSGSSVTLRAMLGWRHVFGDRSPDVNMGFIAGGPFTIEGVPLAANSLATELGVEASPRKNLRLALSYSGQLGGGIDDHGGKASVEWKF